MKLRSNDFVNGALLPGRFASYRENIRPHLSWEQLPLGTQSLVILCDDPDAIKPAGKVWVHWVAYNISPDCLSTDNLVHIQEGMTDFGTKGYGGPNPPDGEHRYYFELFALNTAKIDLAQRITRDEFAKKYASQILDSAIITCRHIKS